MTCVLHYFLCQIYLHIMLHLPTLHICFIYVPHIISFYRCMNRELSRGRLLSLFSQVQFDCAREKERRHRQIHRKHSIYPSNGTSFGIVSTTHSFYLLRFCTRSLHWTHKHMYTLTGSGFVSHSCSLIYGQTYEINKNKVVIQQPLLFLYFHNNNNNNNDNASNKNDNADDDDLASTNVFIKQNNESSTWAKCASIVES